MSKNRFFELIEQYDIITIYRHTAADPDALGSQFGLKQWISETYPDKKVYALGHDLGSQAHLFPNIDDASLEDIKQSLAIILDTGNAERIDDQRYLEAAYRLKIDHHINVHHYADEEYVIPTASATCEILATLFDERNIVLSKETAKHLYIGLTTDTAQFTTNNTTATSLRMAAYLAESGIDLFEINQSKLNKSYKEYEFENYLRSKVTLYKEAIAFVMVSRKEYESFGLNYNQAKEKVYIMKNVSEFEAWALFCESEADATLYNASLRSKHIAVSDIAYAHHGGGHRNASGVKDLTSQDVEDILEEMSLAYTNL